MQIGAAIAMSAHVEISSHAVVGAIWARATKDRISVSATRTVSRGRARHEADLGILRRLLPAVRTGGNRGVHGVRLSLARGPVAARVASISLWEELMKGFANALQKGLAQSSPGDWQKMFDEVLSEASDAVSDVMGVDITLSIDRRPSLGPGKVRLWLAAKTDDGRTVELVHIIVDQDGQPAAMPWGRSVFSLDTREGIERALETLLASEKAADKLRWLVSQAVSS
jgi:hypothetical protein